MITLFVRANCPECETIREALKGLCLAYERIMVSNDHAGRGLPKGTEPPVLVDGETVITGSRNILGYLDEIAEFKARWEKFQSDACYYGKHGDIE